MNELYNLKPAIGSTFVNEGYEYSLKVRRFMNKSVDLIVQKLNHKIPSNFKEFQTGEMTTYTKTLDANEERLRELEIQERAERRARQMVQFAVRQIDADHMITLTTRQSFKDRKEFFKYFTKFIKLVREKDLKQGQLVDRIYKVSPISNPQMVKRDFYFVAVPELQERGAYHMHMGVTGRQDIELLRACWYTALGGNISDRNDDTLGAVNVTYAQKIFGNESEHFKKMKLVNYLVKYVSKSFNDDGLTGDHRYTKSRGIPKPPTNRFYLNSCFSLGTGAFLNVILETIECAKILGIGSDYTLFNRGEDFLILRGRLEDHVFDGVPF